MTALPLIPVGDMLDETPTEQDARMSAIKRGATDAETCRLNGWGVGTMLEADGRRITLTAIGRDHILAIAPGGREVVFEWPDYDWRPVSVVPPVSPERQGTWRVGHRVPTSIYRDGDKEPLFTIRGEPELCAKIVAFLNADAPTTPDRPDAAPPVEPGLWSPVVGRQGVTREHGPTDRPIMQHEDVFWSFVQGERRGWNADGSHCCGVRSLDLVREHVPPESVPGERREAGR